MCRPGGRLVYRPPVRPQPQPIKHQPKQHACPLTSAEVAVAIKDFCASVSLTQKFKNVEDVPIEAVYQFPLDEKYCINDFTAEIDGKVIKGKCKEKEEAKDMYDDAIAEGHGAYLLEQDETDPNIFKMNVGNLPPGKEVNVSITYVAELEFVDGALQFVLATSKAKESKGENLPGLKMKVDLQMTSNIRSLSSPSHPISFEFGEEPTQAQVLLGAEGATLQKDFVLNVKLAKPHAPCAQVQKDKEGNLAAMVALYPEIQLGEDEEIYTECIFLIDRSGSMAGSRINQVRDTMQIFLRSLGEGTLFNIVGFGSRAEFLFKQGSVEYNDKNLEIATNHIKTLAANLGGTNILKPLIEILKSNPVEGYPRQLFILTDGEVDNTQQCIDCVRNNAHTTRVFTFGIGNEASQELVKGMAKAGEGFYEFVQTGENMEAKVMRQLSRAMKPALTDIEIDWGELAAQQSPFRLPPLFLGGRIVVYGFLPQGSKEGDVTLRAKTAIKPFETTVHLKPEEAKEGTLFHSLGAKQMIRDLEEGRSFMHTLDRQLLPGKSAEQVKQECIRLSTRYGVLCKLTAFVAIEERDEATEGTMQVRKIGIDTPPAPVSAPPMPKQQQQQQQQQQQLLSSSPRRLSSTSTSSSSAPGGGGRGGAMPARPISAGAPPPPAPSRSAPMYDAISAAPPAAKRKGGFSLFGKSKSSAAAPPAPIQQAEGGALRSRRSAVAVDEDKKKSKSKKVMKEKKMDSRKKEKEKECEKSEAKRNFAKFDAADFSLSAAAPPAPAAESLSFKESNYSSLRASSDDDDEAEESESDSDVEEKKEEEVVEAAPADMRNIIMKQKASGSWSLSEVSGLLGSLTAEKIKKALSSLIQGDAGGDVENLWVTAVVVAYLQVKWPRQKINWELVVGKGQRWINKQAKSTPVKPEGFDFIGEAMKFVKAN